MKQKQQIPFTGQNRFKNRPGMVLVVAILMLAVMSTLAVLAFKGSTLDLNISTNAKIARQAFYFTDAGVEMAPKFVRSAIDNRATPVVANVTFAPNLEKRLLGFEAANTSSTLTSRDFYEKFGKNEMGVNITRVHEGYLSGSGVEFGTGSEGVGVGSSGGLAVFFQFDSAGNAYKKSTANINVYYRYIVGTAGGK